MLLRVLLNWRLPQQLAIKPRSVGAQCRTVLTYSDPTSKMAFRAFTLPLSLVTPIIRKKEHSSERR